jgi:hypothetical protein
MNELFTKEDVIQWRKNPVTVNLVNELKENIDSINNEILSYDAREGLNEFCKLQGMREALKTCIQSIKGEMNERE